ncbi:hypothetical protein KY285_025972 [Solanum tuberosum]|nr:hypothetical protein KY285_025972 [Solanum tuberosum]
MSLTLKVEAASGYILDLFNCLEVLDEIGIDVASQLSAAPKGKIAGKRTEESSRFVFIFF